MDRRTVVSVEKMTIPTYPIMDCEKLPMFNENRNHQGTTGNPYPIMPVLSVQRENCQPKEYEVVRLENDYIRLIMIPALGGRIFEAYDKINQYDFLYRQHVIKPALIGAYGLWISGGLEFNWPFHHRPSTFMPVNFSTEVEPDGTAICWLSECDPTDRTRATVGIVLHPDAAFFETRMQVANRTPIRHSFLMWQNGAVRVNDDYQFIFPPDVRHVTHHHSIARAPLTYPIAQGEYGGSYYDDPTDITWYKNNKSATSHFAAPSRYDFFGGYDQGKQCGVIHVANHHTSPGKKMFTWGSGALGKSWEKALTDEDGPYCELMASSYSNNQPDFTWLNPYETKCFSEFWYPVGAIGRTSFATLDAAVCVSLAEGALRVETTRAQKGLRVTLSVAGRVVLEDACDTSPCLPQALSFEPCEGMYEVTVSDQNGRVLLHYAEEKVDELHFPEPVALRPHPDTLKTVQELYLQGVHLDQYRDPLLQPDVYFEEALRREPDHIPSLIALGQYRYRRGWFDEARALLEKAVRNEHIYNLHYPDGEAEYLLGLVYDALGRTEQAYDTFWLAAWSSRSVPEAMCKVAALDGRRGDYARMLADAQTAVEAAARHPLANAYAALAEWKLGKADCARAKIGAALRLDPMNELLIFAGILIDGREIRTFWEHMRSDYSQTALDVAFDLIDAGFCAEAAAMLRAVEAPSTPMIGYTLAYVLRRLGEDPAEGLAGAAACMPQNAFPYRLGEISVLEEAVKDPADAKARDLLACILYDKGHFERATQLWEEAHRLDGGCALYARNLAVALFSHMGRRDEAMALLVEAMELAPENDQLKLEYLYAATKYGVPGEKRLEVIAKHPVRGRVKDDYVLEWAKACCVAGRYDDAEKVMLAHDFVPAEGGEKAITGLYYAIRLHKAREALRDGDGAAALAILSALHGKLPENLHAGNWTTTELVPIYYYEGVALEKLGRHEEALESFSMTVRRLNPALLDLAFYYGSALRALGREIEARVYLSRVMRAIETREAQRCTGWEDSVAMFNAYMNDPVAQRKGMDDYYLGMIRKYEGRDDEARRLLEESRALWPENLNTWIELDF